MREALHPWRHKAAVAGSLLVVGALTVLGVITSDTASRQGSIEHTVKVERIRVNSALCSSKTVTGDCRRHAIELLRACIATPTCEKLLRRIHRGEIGILRHPRSGPEQSEGPKRGEARAGPTTQSPTVPERTPHPSHSSHPGHTSGGSTGGGGSHPHHQVPPHHGTTSPQPTAPAPSPERPAEPSRVEVPQPKPTLPPQAPQEIPGELGRGLEEAAKHVGEVAGGTLECVGSLAQHCPAAQVLGNPEVSG